MSVKVGEIWDTVPGSGLCVSPRRFEPPRRCGPQTGVSLDLITQLLHWPEWCKSNQVINPVLCIQYNLRETIQQRARTWPILVRCWQRRADVGLVLTHHSMLSGPGKIQQLIPTMASISTTTQGLRRFPWYTYSYHSMSDNEWWQFLPRSRAGGRADKPR